MTTRSALALLSFAVAAQAACPLNGAFDNTADLFASKTVVNHAAGWGVRYFKFYKEVRVADMTYQLVHCNANTTEYAKMEAELPACGDKCNRFTVPVENAAVLGNEVVGFLEELQQLDSVKFVGSPAVSPCLASKTSVTTAATLSETQLATVDAVFVTKVGQSPSAKHVDMAKLHEETSPMGKLEWVEFVSLFYNAEAMANYVLYRSQQSYDASSHLAKSQDAKKVMWVAKTTSTEVTMTSDLFLKNLLADANVEIQLFGLSVEIKGQVYHDAMKAADAIIVTDGMRHEDAAELLTELGVPMADKVLYKALNYDHAKHFRLYQVDKFITAQPVASGHLGNDWEEHVFAAPDLMLSDMMKATGDAAPWSSAPWVYLRAAENKPIAIAPRVGKECGNDVFGAARPTSLKQVRLAVLGGLKKADANPTQAIENFEENMDYFPDKIDPEHAEDFDVEYHLTWKLVRDNRQNFAYVLLLKGVPASALPSEYVMSGSKRFNVPVTKVGFSSTTTAPLLLSLGQAETIKVAEPTPESCILKGIEDGRIVAYRSATEEQFKDLDVFYGAVNAWNPPYSVYQSNGVNVQSTSDPGALNRAEWLMFTAAFHNAEKIAEKTFTGMKAKFLCAQQKGKQATQLVGRRPAFVEISNVYGQPGMFESPQTPYHLQLIKAAGGNAASADSGHPFQKAGTVVQGWSSAVTRFTKEELLEALKHADVVVDNHWSATNTAATPMGWENIKEFYGFPDDMSAYPWYQKKSLYRLDKRMAANGYTEQFVRFTTEPDAVVLDFLGAIHPEVKVAAGTPTYFFRNILTGEAVIEPKAELCTDYKAVEPPLTTQDGTCEIPCAERIHADYCKLGCVWEGDACKVGDTLTVPPAGEPATATPASATTAPVTPTPAPVTDSDDIAQGTFIGVTVALGVVVLIAVGAIAYLVAGQGSSAAKIRSNVYTTDAGFSEPVGGPVPEA
eukprot:TRINITY_DN9275_c0_g1_i5.p1 TRINITY_DN9275_c0_g1~~TRINITY_DN9275_c0_g1_i5.p1  ORF type:complete len:958 (+),score=428.20 TRINITY_DN9275_c0_g1_i5:45-2918(+)